MKLFSTAEAAKYLGMSLPGIKYHVHIAHNLTPQKIGGALIFTQDQLDQFQANRRPQGRPRNERI